jgi:hypothetical protein
MRAPGISKHKTARDAYVKTVGQGIGQMLGLPKGTNPLLDSLLADLERAEKSCPATPLSLAPDAGQVQTPNA